MADPAKLIGVAPILLVKDVQASAQYWKEKVGFAQMDLYGEPQSFAIGARDEIRVMLAQVRVGTKIVPYWQTIKMMWNAYFWVNDAKALYEELIERGAKIDYKLGMKPYGVLEFGIQDLDDQDIAFGQVVR